MDALTGSIRKFGLVDPVLVRAEDLTIIGGHQRVVAARRLGYTTVPVVELDLSLEEARLLNIGLNKLGGSFDSELLGRLLADLGKTPGIDLALTGFAEDELKALLRKLDQREKRDRPETFDFAQALEEARKAPVAQRGDTWLLGPHRVRCGDANDPEDVAALLGDTRAAMAFTDPPYNVAYQGGTTLGARRRKIANDNLGQDFPAFLETACRNLLNVTDGAVYLCMSPRSCTLSRQRSRRPAAAGPPS